MTKLSLQITDIKFSEKGNYLAVGYNHGKVELWGKTDSSWLMQWEVKYTCLPVLSLAYFKNHLVAIEEGWQLFFLDSETGWIVKSVILDFNVYKNCCPSSIVFAVVQHGMLFVASETGPVYIVDLDCLLNEASDPIVNLSQYNRYKFEEGFQGVNFFSRNEPCSSVIGRLAVPESISWISITDDQSTARGIGKNGRLLNWNLYALELTTEVMYQTLDLPYYNVTGIELLNARYMIITGHYDNEAAALLMDVKTGIILDRLNEINPFGIRKGINASSENFVFLATNKLLLLEIQDNRFKILSYIPWPEKISTLIYSGSAIDFEMDNNTIALSCNDDVILVDIFSKDVDTLKTPYALWV